MKRSFVGLTMAAMLCVTLFGATAARADQTVNWTGNGLDSVTLCVKGVNTPYLHWVLTPGGQPVDGTTAELFIQGKDVGTMVPVGAQGALQLTIAVSPKISIEQLEHATVYADITSGSVGDNAVLTISDGCLCRYDS
ncbi:MAG: hypothetical protein E6G40_10155 [Actinobacteria bacterium]|nr:MAG: hypothetical protein E6G40_10155 [Actinomycetota bacterium]